MPVYEFACDRCRKVLQFFFRSVRVGRGPVCPHCGGRRLRRLLSGFSVGGRRGERSPSPPDATGEPVPDAGRVERAMARLEGEIDDLDESDPRQMGRFLRRMVEETGTDLGPDAEVAIRRLEAGEDPERIDEEMGAAFGDDVGDGEDGYTRDDTLYES